MGTSGFDVSVVIPTVDRPGLLREAIASVLAQTVPPREIVVVDNGITDWTAEMLRSFDGAVRRLSVEPLGVQFARNRGVAATSGAWVALLDDDDLWRPDYLATVAAAAADGRADLVMTDHRKFHHPGGIGQRYERTNIESAPAGYWDDIPRPEGGADWSFAGAFPAERLLCFNPAYPSTLVLRRALFERVGGYDPRVRGIKAEDIEFLTRALPVARTAIVWKPLVDYRIHDRNASGNSATRQFFGRWRIFEFVHRENRHGSPALARALERDLPERRRAVFALALRENQRDVLDEVVPLMGARDWTASRTVRRWLGTRMPGGTSLLLKLASAARDAPSRLAGGRRLV